MEEQADIHTCSGAFKRRKLRLNGCFRTVAKNAAETEPMTCEEAQVQRRNGFTTRQMWPPRSRRAAHLAAHQALFPPRCAVVAAIEVLQSDVVHRQEEVLAHLAGNEEHL